MQANLSIIILIIGVFAFIGALNSAAFSGEHDQTAKYYESCIVKEIVKCNSKLVLLRTSKSKNLQDYARTEAQKAVFFDAEKEMLVKEMIEMQLDPKHYKVELFLNRRFQEGKRHRE